MTEAATLQGGHSPAIVKSGEDKKEYRYVTLPSGLTAMLVHDPEITSNSAGEVGVAAEQDEEVEDADDGED